MQLYWIDIASYENIFVIEKYSLYFIVKQFNELSIWMLVLGTNLCWVMLIFHPHKRRIFSKSKWHFYATLEEY